MRRFASWISASTRSAPVQRAGVGRPAAPRRRAATRPRPPARRPSRRRPRTAAARRRRRPRCGAAGGPCRSRPAYADPIVMRSNAQVGLADADRRRRASSRRGAVERAAVDERAVRRADVLDPDAVAARLDARVAGRGELVASSATSFCAAATDRDRRRVERGTRSPLGAPGCATTTSRACGGAAARLLPRPACLRREHEALLRRAQMSRLAVRTMRQMKR